MSVTLKTLAQRSARVKSVDLHPMEPWILVSLYLGSVGTSDYQSQVWDYETKSSVQTLESHTHNVSTACFHPELPIITTGLEDGTVRIWHATTYGCRMRMQKGKVKKNLLSLMLLCLQMVMSLSMGIMVTKSGTNNEGNPPAYINCAFSWSLGVPMHSVSSVLRTNILLKVTLGLRAGGLNFASTSLWNLCSYQRLLDHVPLRKLKK